MNVWIPAFAGMELVMISTIVLFIPKRNQNTVIKFLDSGFRRNGYINDGTLILSIPTQVGIQW